MNSEPAEKTEFEKLANRIKNLEERQNTLYIEAFDMISKDMHQASDRPCGTCSFISRVIGKPFGCYEYQEKIKVRNKVIRR